MSHFTHIYTSLIEEVLIWIESNLNEKLTVKAVAEKAGYSPWHLQRIFKQQTGIALGEYICKKRIDRAIIDLIEKNDKIIEIAYRYGFNGQQDFTRVFKRVTGHPPASYRNENLKDK